MTTPALKTAPKTALKTATARRLDVWIIAVNPGFPTLMAPEAPGGVK